MPVGFDTDVNGAALGEWQWGATAGRRQSVYVTVGMGIGGGVPIGGRPVHGTGHPEMGHVAVEPDVDDEYPGLCPHHDNRLDWIASGPAIADRIGQSAGALTEDEQEVALQGVAFFFGQGLRNVVYALAPECIVIGVETGSTDR